MTVWEDDICVHVIEMPYRIKSFITKDSMGDYAIFINSLLSESERKERYEHELKHFRNQDLAFDSGINVSNIEYERHNIN